MESITIAVDDDLAENSFPHSENNSKAFARSSSTASDPQAQYNSDLALARALQQQEQLHAFISQHGYHPDAPPTASAEQPPLEPEPEQEEDEYVPSFTSSPLVAGLCDRTASSHIC